tara:strand:+ start:109 stop:522 length:414 start_codon:yes stop_codon:yes gene_type:complete
MQIDYTNHKYTVGPIVSGASKIIQSVKIEFETGKKPPEAIRRSQVSMFDLPIAEMPVESVFRLCWSDYEEQYNHFFGAHPIHQKRDERLGQNSEHDYLKKYINQYRIAKNRKNCFREKRFRYLPVYDPIAIDVWRTM